MNVSPEFGDTTHFPPIHEGELTKIEFKRAKVEPERKSTKDHEAGQKAHRLEYVREVGL